ncbi:MAG: SMP-30/gluconolactonase/LRE family protein [Candidatus Methylomirabilales bacterium]
MSESSSVVPHIAAVEPSVGVEGGTVVVVGTGFLSGGTPPLVFLGEAEARPSIVSDIRLVLPLPLDATAGPLTLMIDTKRISAPFTIGAKLATGLHPVANPVVDAEGVIYTTISGRRGQKVPAPLVCITPAGAVEHITVPPINPTGLALQPDGSLLTSSRYDGCVYRLLLPEGDTRVIAEDLGIATGLCLDEAGVLYIGDRTGTVYRMSPEGQAESFASLPPSVAAFHLTAGPDGNLYATAPTLSNQDVIYQINSFGDAEPYWGPLERPQGLAFDRQGRLWVTAGIGGHRGVYMFSGPQAPRLMVTGANLVGLAFAPDQHLILASISAIFRIPPFA